MTTTEAIANAREAGMKIRRPKTHRDARQPMPITIISGDDPEEKVLITDAGTMYGIQKRTRYDCSVWLLVDETDLETLETITTDYWSAEERESVMAWCRDLC